MTYEIEKIKHFSRNRGVLVLCYNISSISGWNTDNIVLPLVFKSSLEVIFPKSIIALAVGYGD